MEPHHHSTPSSASSSTADHRVAVVNRSGNERIPYSFSSTEVDIEDTFMTENNQQPSAVELKLSASNSWKGVLTMISLVGTSVIELVNHHPVIQMLGFK